MMKLFRASITSFLLIVAMSVSLANAIDADSQAMKIFGPSKLSTTHGLKLLADYGSFGLYQVDPNVLSSLPVEVRRDLTAAGEMDRILIDVFPFDTQRETPSPPDHLKSGFPSGYALHLVQFVGPIKEEWLKSVGRTGSQLVHYIAHNAYVVWTDDFGRSQLNDYAKQKQFIQYSGPYHPYYKLGPTLIDRAVRRKNLDEKIRVRVQLYSNPGKSVTENLVGQSSLMPLSAWGPVLHYQNATARVKLRDLILIAQRPDVFWIGEYFDRELFDEVQDQILAGALDGSSSGPSGPGYKAWLDALGFSQNSTDYPIVDITDDGIGGGSAPTSPVNPPTNDPTLDPRIVYRISCNSSYPNDGRSPDGHGHINASIAVGLDERTGSPYQDADGFRRGLGVNPYGRVGGTRIFGGAYNVSLCGGTDSGVIQSSYNAGARISSNSWGCSGCAGSYDDSSQAYDAGTRDALPGTPGNQELITIFAAGNSGPGSSTVGSPGNGKNMITVGASENDRPTWTDGCGIGPTGADHAMDVISFSSRGPSPGNRKKPEIIAPGTHIQGTASTHSSYNGNGVCDQYLPSGQTVFAASSGTSHSTPAVAGVASLYYRWLQSQRGIASPSPALMKAFLMAHTRYLTGVGANDTLPSNSQGYGMPDLAMAFDATPRDIVNQTVTFDNTGEFHTITGTVADITKPVRIAMAFTDAPGALGTSPQVNNLDLTVVLGGNTYRGNVFSGQQSTTGGAADSLNNYEAVFLPAGASGSFSITITAANIAGNGIPNVGDGTDQDFALVCYNCNVVQTPLLTEISTAISDSCSVGGAGSGNGYVEPGENAVLNVTAQNVGTLAATGISATLSSVTPGVTITDSSATFPDLSAGASAPSNAPHFDFTVDSSVPCGTVIDFDIAFTSNEGSWNDSFTRVVGGSTSSNLLNENFSGGIPGTWSVVDGGTGGGVAAAWTTANPGSRSIGAPFSTPFAIVDSDRAGTSATQDEQLITPILNASSCSEVMLQFSNQFRWYSLGPAETADVDVSIGGGSWTNVLRMQGASDGYTVPNTKNLNLSTQAAGQSDVRVRFRYYNGSFDWWWAIDNVVVSCSSAVCNNCNAVLPEETTSVGWGSSKTSLSWDATPLAEWYTVYRGGEGDLPNLLNTNADSCDRWNGTGLTTGEVLTQTPAPGTFWWYIVRPGNAAGEGPAGDATSGPRILNSSGDCP